MREKSRSVHVQLTSARCRSRVDQVKEIASSFRFSLPDPHDFSPSTADICWIPEVRKAVVDGTDEEFHDCIVDIRSKISELSAGWFEERINFFMRLLPQDPPTQGHLSLATTLIDCTRCRKVGMHIEEALSHHCCFHYNDGFKAQFSNVTCAHVYYSTVGSPWNSGLAEYRYSTELASLTRDLLLECGENPNTITVREMNRRNHRFVRFDSSRITVLNWVEAVSSGAWSPDDVTSHLPRAVSSN